MDKTLDKTLATKAEEAAKQEKISLLTGAAGGIGREIARLLDHEGYRQILVDLNEEKLNSVASELSIAPHCIVSNITDVRNVASIREQVQSRFGRLDVLVNNAGVIMTTPFDEAHYDEIDREYSVNYRAVLHFMREFIPVMKRQKSGNIVTISSLGGILPLKEAPGYCGSKFGVRGFMLAQNIALRRHGITVSTIYPTAIDTPMLEHEALHGGSLLNFVSDPLKPVQVAQAVIRAIKKRKMEIAVPTSEGYLCKFLGFFPGVIPSVLPFVERIADRNRLKYIKRKGLAPM